MTDIKKFIFNARGYGCSNGRGSWSNIFMFAVLDIMLQARFPKTIPEIRQIFYKEYDKKYSICDSTKSHHTKSTYPDKIIYECVYQHSTNNKRQDRASQDIFFDSDAETDRYMLNSMTLIFLGKKKYITA